MLIVERRSSTFNITTPPPLCHSSARSTIPAISRAARRRKGGLEREGKTREREIQQVRPQVLPAARCTHLNPLPAGYGGRGCHQPPSTMAANSDRPPPIRLLVPTVRRRRTVRSDDNGGSDDTYVRPFAPSPLTSNSRTALPCAPYPPPPTLTPTFRPRASAAAA
jgi:hypothetical protein